MRKPELRKPELGTERPGLQTSTGRKLSSPLERRALTLLLNSEEKWYKKKTER